MHPDEFQKHIEDSVLAGHKVRLKVAELETPMVVAGCQHDQENHQIALITRDGACWSKILFDAKKIERAPLSDRYHIRDNEGDKMMLLIQERAASPEPVQRPPASIEGYQVASSFVSR